jgi:transcriptional regulator
MYLRPAFVETDTARIVALIRENPFGLLLTMAADASGNAPEIAGSHIPFTVQETAGGFRLAAHLSADNAQCAQLAGGQAMAVFTGPHAYIAPGWYRTQPAVPTWDYCAVHVHGTLSLLEDEAEIHANLRSLAERDPAGFDLDALPEVYRRKMVAGTRGFCLSPTKIEAQWKMSQNRSVADRQSVVAALRAQDDSTASQVADLIAGTLPTS